MQLLFNSIKLVATREGYKIAWQTPFHRLYSRFSTCTICTQRLTPPCMPEDLPPSERESEAAEALAELAQILVEWADQ